MQGWATQMRRPLLLSGFMATGKSTVGRLVAERTRRPFVDLDARLEARLGMSIPAFFAARGEAGFRVEAVPGACAAVVALAPSGLPTDEFHFAGFLPHKTGQRIRELERLATLPGTIVLYESPYRIEKLLEELGKVVPQRQIAVGRELTKKFEEFWRGTAAEIAKTISKHTLKGEFVVLNAPVQQRRKEAPDGDVQEG